MFRHTKIMGFDDPVKDISFLKKDASPVQVRPYTDAVISSIDNIFFKQNLAFSGDGMQLQNDFSLFPQIDLNPISRSMHNAKLMVKELSKSVFEHCYRAMFESTEKKAWSSIILTYGAASAYYIYSVAPLIKNMFSLSEISAGITSMVVSSFYLFAAIPFFSTSIVANMVGLFRGPECEPLPMQEKDLPHVTITIPTYNEPLELLKSTSLRSALEVDYPKDKLDIVVLSNGVRKPELEAYCTEYGITFIHRDGKEGGKARNLNISLGLRSYADNVFYRPKGNLFLQIDCDIEFAPDLLKKSVPEFRDNQKLPFLVYDVDDKGDDNLFNQPIAALNRARSKLTHTVERIGHATSGGYAILYQKAAFEDVGGWKEDFVGEDWATGLSLRAEHSYWDKGKRISYVHVVDHSPEDLDRFKVQQKRWAKGGVESLRRIMPSFVHAKHIPWNEKADMCYRFSYYPLSAYMFAIAPLILSVTGIIGLQSHADFSLVNSIYQYSRPFGHAFLGIIGMDFINLVMSKKIKQAFQSIVFIIPAFLGFISAGLSIAKGVFEGFSSDTIFHVTPKGKIQTKNPFIDVVKKHYKELIFGGVLFSISFMLPFAPIFIVASVSFMVGPFLSLIPLKRNKK